MVKNLIESSMRFLQRLLFVSFSILASLLIMFNFNPSYKLTFNRIIREVFDKNDLYDSYGQKMITDTNQPSIVAFIDFDGDALFPYLQNINLAHIVQKFIKENFGINMYLITAVPENDSKVKILRDYVMYFDSVSKSKRNFAIEATPALRKQLKANSGSLLFINKNKVLSKIDIYNSAIKIPSTKFLNSLDNLCRESNGEGIFERFLTGED